jgi:hypothetical protein
VRVPDFFSTILPNECLHHQLTKEHFKRFGDLPVANGDAGVRVNLTVPSGVIPIPLRKKESSATWEVIDENTSTNLATLPPGSAANLEHLLSTLPDIISKGPKTGE